MISGTGFDHAGLLYRGRAEYVTSVTGLVRTAVAAGQPVLVAVPGPGLAMLREALADLTGQVTFADMAVAGRNPGRIIPGVLQAFAEAAAGRRPMIVGEPVWPGRTDLEYPACAQHEALINAVFADADAAILCPYDALGLPPVALADAWRSHPYMIEHGARRRSDAYADPFTAAAAFNQELPATPATAESLPFHSGTALADVRRFVRRRAAGVLSADRTADLVLAANEVATNTLEHTAGVGRISIWPEPGRLVCQVDDHGRLTDPLAGRLLPPPGRYTGRGLILTHDVCDLVRVHTTAAGTSIRLHMSRLR